MIQKKILIGSGIAGIISVIAIIGTIPSPLVLSSSCDQIGMFDEKTKNSNLNQYQSNKEPSVYLSTDNTIAFLYDDFTRYGDSQKILDEFDNPNSWQVNNEEEKLRITDEYYGGNNALVYDVNTPTSDIVLSKSFSDLQNLTRWQKSGYITMWINIENSTGIDSLGIELEDKDGNTRFYQSLPNIHTIVPNTFGNEKEYPDLVYPEGDPKLERWVDYQLTTGWNYVLWRADNFTDNGAVNMDKIKKVNIQVELNTTNFVTQQIIFDDLRIQDGIQKYSNPTHGMWYPPHGRPQYGVYDIDKVGNDYELRLLNVRNTQYPSNGDHGRMISPAPVPNDFAFKTQFTFTRLKDPETSVKIPVPFGLPLPKIPMNVDLRNNTYFRVTYDFEPEYDPGHDWFGAYLSLQYNRLGLSSVWPIERSILQDQEPKAGSKIASTDFTVQNNVKYEMDMIVEGQTASVAIYEVNGKCLNEKAEMIYTFHHPRHTERYPIAIESTGNLLSRIHEVEIVSLDTNSSNSLKRIF